MCIRDSRMGGYEDVIPLIDLYDAAQSDTANYMTDFNEATLVISGDLDLGKYSVDDYVKMKRNNLLLLRNGINPDGSRSETSAGYIYKEYDVNGTEAYKDRLQSDIHKISFVPDLADKESVSYTHLHYQKSCRYLTRSRYSEISVGNEAIRHTGCVS